MACAQGISEELLDFQKKNNKNPQDFYFASKKGEIIPLKRGGVLVKTKLGWIQFGIPPETVKDSLNLGVEVPSHYVIPSVRFDKKMGINVAEFEFPAYFNYFLKKRKINLICTKDAYEAIKIIFQETLLGPKDYEVNSNYYHSLCIFFNIINLLSMYSEIKFQIKSKRKNFI